MSQLTQSDLLEQLRWRYAVKRFDPDRQLDNETWDTLENAMILAPSSYGLQPWRFIVITDQAIKSQLPAISWNQTQPRDCSHMVVLAARRTLDATYIDTYLQSMISIRGGQIETLKGFRSMLLNSIEVDASKILDWNTAQVYIALGQLMTAAAILGVDTCPMEGIERPAYDKILGLDSSDYTTVVGCAVGYRHPEDKYAAVKKVRFSSHELVQHI